MAEFVEVEVRQRTVLNRCWLDCGADVRLLGRGATCRAAVFMYGMGLAGLGARRWRRRRNP